MKKTLLLCAMMALTATVAAQGIYEANTTTANSIVRYWQNRDVIIYNEDPSGKAMFMFYTVGSSNAKYIYLPADISVKDFEIMDKDVWFCGEYHDISIYGGRVGVVGTFNINDVLNGTGDINYHTLNYWIMADGIDMYIRGLARLDLFTVGSQVVMAMTGDAYHYQSEHWMRTTVVSAVLYGGTAWHFEAIFNKNGNIDYTDIAALDNYLTAVGTSGDGNGCLVKTFHKTTSFPAAGVVPYFADSLDTYGLLLPVDKVLITHTINNEAAVVQLEKTGATDLHLLDFSSGSTVPTAPTRFTAAPTYNFSSIPWALHEIRYSSSNNMINVLEYGNLPAETTIETLLWHFQRTPSWTAVPVQPMNSMTQVSMDVDIDNRPVTVGEYISTGNMDIDSFTPGPPTITPTLIETDNCTGYKEISYSNTTPSVIPINISDYTLSDTKPNTTYHPTIYTISFTRKCN